MRVPRASLYFLLAVAAGGVFACVAGPRPDPSDRKPPAGAARAQPPARPELTPEEARARLPGVSLDHLDGPQRAVVVAVAERARCGETTLAGCLAERPAAVLPRRMLGFAEELARLGARPEEAVRVEADYFAAFAPERRVALEVSEGACRGPADAPVTLVEFGDFECFFCASAWGLVHQVADRYPDRVRTCFLHFPLSQHPRAFDAARLAELARSEGRFFELADVLFLEQHALEPPQLVQYAKKAGLDPSKVEKALAEGAFAEAVSAQRAQGERAGVHGTPTLFINGRRFDLPLQHGLLVHAIEDELAWMELGGTWSGE